MENLNIVFYGIGRATAARRVHYQILINNLYKNYRLNIIEVLNDINKLTNQKSNNLLINLKKKFIHKDSFKILKSFSNSNDVKKLLNISLTFEDVHADNYRSVSNFLQQLSMLEDSVKYYRPGLVLAIRDDLLFNEKLLLSYIKKTDRFLLLNKRVFLTSFFHSNTGICERIYFGSYENSLQVLTRINFVKKYFDEINKLSYLKKKGLNAEWLMRFVVEKKKLIPFCVPLFTKRLRVNYIKKERLFSHPRNWIHEKPTFNGLLRYFKFVCLNQF